MASRRSACSDAYRRDRNADDSDKQRTLKEQGFYTGRAWRKVRKLALERDKYLCQWCLRNKRIVPAQEVHHIQPTDKFPALALELSNLVSLCHECHESTKYKRERVLPPGVKVVRIIDGGEREG